MDVASATVRRQGTLEGGYIIKRETSALELILIATGSEVQHAVKVAEELSASIRVVSMPCVERFERQTKQYKEEVLPSGVKKIAIEAGVTALWYKYADVVVGIDSFGFSAPGGTVLDAFGINAANLAEVAQTMLVSTENPRQWKQSETLAKATQSETWKVFECRTNDSLPSLPAMGSKVPSLASLPECLSDDSSVDHGEVSSGEEDHKLGAKP
jgi:hypothetical protein